MTKIAIIGANGMVGNTMLSLLTSDYIVPKSELFLFGNSAAGKVVSAGGRDYTVLALTKENLEKIRPDFALFAAGGDVSREFAPMVAELGGITIDNSSYFRMDKNVPLVVTEVNPNVLSKIKGGTIVANPNCSTIQAVVALKPLLDEFGIVRIIYSTYQAVSGAGKGGIDDLEKGMADANYHKQFAHPIFNNLIPQIDAFMEDGYTKEEAKMINETRKIFGQENLAITCTAVRVPVRNCHSISINVELEKPATLQGVRDALKRAEKDGRGVRVVDAMSENLYPMPMLVDGKDETLVGRIRLDPSRPNCVNLFCVADNVRKGAATNAVQILMHLMKGENNQ